MYGAKITKTNLRRVDIINQVVLIGRLTKDPELRFVAGSGRAVANFPLAVDKNLSREKRQEFEEKGMPTADFIRIVVWGKQAENCANYLVKGRMVAINGSISTGSYKTNTGETRYTTEVLANNVQFLEWGERKAVNNQDDQGDFFEDPSDENLPF